jgi:hypothetical protein
MGHNVQHFVNYLLEEGVVPPNGVLDFYQFAEEIHS